jgi:hypothetical protein
MFEDVTNTYVDVWFGRLAKASHDVSCPPAPHSPHLSFCWQTRVGCLRGHRSHQVAACGCGQSALEAYLFDFCEYSSRLHDVATSTICLESLRYSRREFGEEVGFYSQAAMPSVILEFPIIKNTQNQPTLHFNLGDNVSRARVFLSHWLWFRRRPWKQIDQLRQKQPKMLNPTLYATTTRTCKTQLTSGQVKLLTLSSAASWVDARSRVIRAYRRWLRAVSEAFPLEEWETRAASFQWKPIGGLIMRLHGHIEELLLTNLMSCRLRRSKPCTH